MGGSGISGDKSLLSLLRTPKHLALSVKTIRPELGAREKDAGCRYKLFRQYGRDNQYAGRSNCAQKPIICISNNGKIEQIAKEIFSFYKGSRRLFAKMRIRYLFFSCHRIRRQQILPPIKPDFFIKMENWIERFFPESNNNLAKNIAIKLHNKIALLYSGNKLSPALTRWKTQLSENSKTFAFMNTYPESSHNDIMSWRHPEWFIKQSIPVFFVSCKEHKKVSRQLDISQEIIFKKPSGIISLTSEGDTLLEELFYFIVLGDWVSFYLGILNNENLTEIAEIQLLKQKLGG